MQLKIILEGRNARLPLQYRRDVHGMIYYLLRDDPVYAQKLHDMTPNAGGKTLKGFCFGRLCGSYHMEENMICYERDIQLEIRSAKPDIVLFLNRALQKRNRVLLAGESLAIKQTSLEDRLITASELSIRMQSPLVAYRTIDNQGHTRFFAPWEEEFYTLIKSNAERKWNYFGNGSPFCFQLDPLGAKQAKRVSDTFNGTYITGYISPFKLKSTPEIIDLLYQTGLGAGNSMGFGMFDIEKEG